MLSLNRTKFELVPAIESFWGGLKIPLRSSGYLIGWNVSRHFADTWKGTGFKGQLTAPGKREALLIKRLLDQMGKVTSEVLISGPDDREGEGDTAADENVQTFWKAQMAKARQ